MPSEGLFDASKTGLQHCHFSSLDLRDFCEPHVAKVLNLCEDGDEANLGRIAALFVL